MKKTKFNYKISFFISLFLIFVLCLWIFLLTLNLHPQRYTIAVINVNDDEPFISYVFSTSHHRSVFLYNEQRYEICAYRTNGIYLDDKVIAWLPIRYNFPVGKLYDANTLLLLGKSFEETGRDIDGSIEMRHHLSDCIVLVDLQTGKPNLLFSTLSGTRIVYASVNSDIIVTFRGFGRLRYAIVFNRLSTMEVLRQDTVTPLRNGKNYIFETKGDYLYLYEENDGLIERFSLVFD